MDADWYVFYAVKLYLHISDSSVTYCTSRTFWDRLLIRTGTADDRDAGTTDDRSESHHCTELSTNIYHTAEIIQTLTRQLTLNNTRLQTVDMPAWPVILN